jgi:hypothetical protein
MGSVPPLSLIYREVLREFDFKCLDEDKKIAVMRKPLLFSFMIWR